MLAHTNDKLHPRPVGRPAVIIDIIGRVWPYMIRKVPDPFVLVRLLRKNSGPDNEGETVKDRS